MIFYLKIRFQLVETIRLGIHNDIFSGEGQNTFFGINDVQSRANFISDTHFDEKCFIWYILANFSGNVSFLVSYLSSKDLLYKPLNFSRRGASLKDLYD